MSSNVRWGTCSDLLIQSFKQFGNTFEIGVATLAGIAGVRTAVAVAIGTIIAQLDATPNEGGREPLDLHPTVDAMDFHDITHLWTIIIRGILMKEIIHLLLLLLS